MTAPTTDDFTEDLRGSLQLLEGTLRAGFQRGTFSLAKQAWCLTVLSEARVQVSALAATLAAYHRCLPLAAAAPPTRRKGR